MNEKSPNLMARLLAWRGCRSLGRAAGPIFIGATGGSGTRSVALILRQAGLFLGHEVNEAWDSQPFSTFLRRWIPPYLGLSDPPLSRRRQARMNRALRAALRRHRTGMPRPAAAWVVKNPRSMYLIGYLAGHCPGMRFVHVVRDGRDMAFSTNQAQLLSYYDAWFGAAAEKPLPLKAIELWSKTNLDASLAGRQLLAGRYLCVRFEDLCADPERQVRAILDFLGIQADVGEAARVVRQPATLGRWQGQDPTLLAAIRAAGAPGLVHFGYLQAT